MAYQSYGRVAVKLVDLTASRLHTESKHLCLFRVKVHDVTLLFCHSGADTMVMLVADTMVMLVADIMRFL